MNTEICDNYAGLYEMMIRTNTEYTTTVVCYITAAMVVVIVVFFLLWKLSQPSLKKYKNLTII